jgi:hypothetical protein
MSKATAVALATLASLAIVVTAHGAEQPRPAPIEVYEAANLDHQAITKRALVCIPKFANSGLTTADTIVSSDVEAGYIQARNVWTGYAGGTYRSTVTLEAKDGRFRISHSDLGVMFPRSGWAVMRFPGGAEISFMQAQSFNIATCIQNGPVSPDF